MKKKLFNLFCLLRLPIALGASLMMTFALVYIMQALIDGSGRELDEEPNLNIVEFTRVKQDNEVRTKLRRPEPPPLPDEPPSQPKQMMASAADTDAWSSAYVAPPASLDVGTSLGGYISDGMFLPILKVQPVYPRKALERGLVGWVQLEFTVDEIGRVIDPIVVDHCVMVWRPDRTECVGRPGKLFDKSAINAASKFKYKPRVIDGMAIATAGVRHMISFELDETGSD